MAYRAIGAAIEVHRLLGPGFLESVYQESLEVEFGLRGIACEPRKPVAINYKGHFRRRRSIRVSGWRYLSCRTKSCRKASPHQRRPSYLLSKNDQKNPRPSHQLQRSHPQRRHQTNNSLILTLLPLLPTLRERLRRTRS